MYMGLPQSVAAMSVPWRCRANPKSAEKEDRSMWRQQRRQKTILSYQSFVERSERNQSPILTRRRLFSLESRFRRIFPGFRSRWMIPFSCRTFIAATICCRNVRICGRIDFITGNEPNKLTSQATIDQWWVLITLTRNRANKLVIWNLKNQLVVRCLLLIFRERG